MDIPFCEDDEYQHNDCTMDKSELAYYYSVLDCACTLFVVIGWLWLRSFEKKESENLDRATVTASDFTIRITKLPTDTTERALAGHFAKITACSVVDVNLAYDNSAEIDLYLGRGKLMKERFLLVHKIRYHLTMAKKFGDHMLDESELNGLKKAKQECSDKIEEIDSKRSRVTRTNPHPIQAFVTFDTEDGFLTAIKQYQLSWYHTIKPFSWCCYPKFLRFKGMKINAKPAPEPSTILWENLSVSYYDRLWRKCQTTCLALVAILVSVVVAFYARSYQQTIMAEGGTGECIEGWSSLTTEAKVNFVTSQAGEDYLHCYCDELGYVEQWNDAFCKQHVKDVTMGQGVYFGASAVVTFMNTAIEYIMYWAAGYEKHHSLDSMEASIMIRVFVLQFINSGCLVLLFSQEWLKEMIGITEGEERQNRREEQSDEALRVGALSAPRSTLHASL